MDHLHPQRTKEFDLGATKVIMMKCVSIDLALNVTPWLPSTELRSDGEVIAGRRSLCKT